MKMFRFNSKQILIAHLGDETMYFLYSNWYSKLVKKIISYVLNKYDILIFEGKMANDLAKKNNIIKPKAYVSFLGVPKERMHKLLSIKPNFNNKNIVFLSSGPGGWRTWYKGLDIMIEAYALAFETVNDMTFTIIGDWDYEVQDSLLSKYTYEIKNSIHFVGYVNNIEDFLSNGSLYLHTSRGDAFPTVVLEAIYAGLIPIVSEWTGSKEILIDDFKDLIVELDIIKISKKIIWFMNLSTEKKEIMSTKLRQIGQKYTEENAISHYKSIFNDIINNYCFK